MLRSLLHRFGFHPRAWLHGLLTYPRFIGRIKPALLSGTEPEILARLAALQRAWEPSRLPVPVGKRIVVVAPHPDDETIGSGGLLLAHRGTSSLNIVTVFSGDAGGQIGAAPWVDTPEYKARLVQQRKAELAEVARILQAESVHALDLPDGYSTPGMQDAHKLREVIQGLRPDVVVIPWFLDNLPDHRMANLLYAASCGDLDCLVLGSECWSLGQPNAWFDITSRLQEKLELVRLYRSQLATVDYERLVKGLAYTRGFQFGSEPRRSSAAEAYLALPNRDYCDIVRGYYGTPGSLSAESRRIFSF